MNHSPIKVGDRVRVNTQSVWRNAFAVVTKVYQYSDGQGWYYWDYRVRLIQPTRRPSYRESWGTLIPQRTLNLLIFSDVTVVRVPHVYIETSRHASRIANFPANGRASALDAALNALDDQDLQYPTVVEPAYHDDDSLIRFFEKDA